MNYYVDPPHRVGVDILSASHQLLDLCSQGQTVRAFFIGMGFFTNFVKSTKGVLIKCVRKLYRQVAHDLIIVDL